MVRGESWRSPRLGAQIRAERRKAGLSLAELHERTGISLTMISAMERGARGIKSEHVERIDAALSTEPMFQLAWDKISGSALPSWFQDAAKRERAAREIRAYNPLVVPGLLQTEGYAWALIRAGLPSASNERVNELVQARMARQSLLSGSAPPRFLAVLDEMALRRPVGGHAIMKPQLERLEEAVQGFHVRVQIIPFATEHHPGLNNAFSLYRLDSDGALLLFVEARSGGMAIRDPEQTVDHLQFFADLQAVALPPDQSARLLTKLR